MKNSLFTKVLAWLLCALMVIGYLPNVAFADDTWEGETDVVEPSEPEGPSGATPEDAIYFDFVTFVSGAKGYTTDVQTAKTYYTTNTMGQWEVAITGEGDFSVVIGEETYNAVNGEVALGAMAFNPYVSFDFAIDGTGEFQIMLIPYAPEGTMDNPAAAQLGDNIATIEAGSQGYFWSYTAEKDGELVVWVNGNDGWTYCVNNLTSYAYGDSRWHDDEDTTAEVINVTAGDEISIMVNTYDPANPWGAPAGSVNAHLYYKADVVLPSGTSTLKFQGASLTLQSSLSINFKVTPETLAAFDNVYAVFTMGDTTVVVPAEEAYLVGDRYHFDFNGVGANMMNDLVSAKLYGTYKGLVYDNSPYQTVNYGVITYCKNQLKNSASNTALCTMIVDLLNYGAVAQQYTGRDPDNLVNSFLTEEQKALGTAATPEMTNVQGYESKLDTTKVNFSGAALILGSSIVQRIKLDVVSGDISNYVVKVVGTRDTWTFTAEDLEPIAGTNSYYLMFDKLYATEMSEVIFITVYEGETAVSHTFRYSIESYAAKNHTSNNPAYLGALLTSMMKFGNSTAKYFG